MGKAIWDYIDVSVLNFNDEKTWQLIRDARTEGVFQLESSGMKETCKRVQPTCMEDLIAILALYRPDTMAELEHFIRRKNGTEPITYLHPDLEPIMNTTYGCMIYQEQVMAITKVFGGFSDAEADKFRKGIGKKDPALVKAQADKFRGRAIEKGYSEDVINELADYLAKMGGYMFNKGHSTGYGITSYKTAYLKANWPIQFMCALLSNQKKPTGQTDYESIGLYIIKTLDMGINITYPNVNTSKPRFSINNGDIEYGLNLIKGIGNTAVEAILQLRPFTSFEDLIEKAEKNTVINKSVIVSLVKSGAMDFTGVPREQMLRQYGDYRFWNGLDDKIKPIKNINKNHIEELLKANIIKDYETNDKEYCLTKLNRWRELQFKEKWEDKEMAGCNEFKWEYDTISYCLKGNPFEGIEIPPWDNYEDGDETTRIGGVIISIKKTKIKRGKQAGRQMAFVNIDTVEGIREVTIFANDFEKHQEIIKKGEMVVIRGKKEGDKLLCNLIKTLDDFKIDLGNVKSQRVNTVSKPEEFSWL